MKTFTHTPTENLSHLRDTETLVRLLGTMLMMIQRFGHMPGCLKRYARQAAGLKRDLVKARIHNLRVTLKWGMLRTSKMRARVLADLGGEKALLKWEIRWLKSRRAADSRPGAPAGKSAARRTETPEAAKKQPPRIKTDRMGLFRLAPIPKAASGAIPEKPFRGYDWEIKARMAEIVPKPIDLQGLYENCQFDETGKLVFGYEPDIDNLKPIPVYPKELRGEAIESEPEFDTLFETVIAGKREAKIAPLKLDYQPAIPVMPQPEQTPLVMAALDKDRPKAPP